MESINSFNGGMSSDLSKTIQSKDSYLQALNFRAITELGGSNGSLVNIKGNECGITFPSFRGMYKLKVTELTGTNNAVVTITVNGQTTTPLTITSGTQGSSIAAALEKLSNCYSRVLPNANATFAVSYSDDYVIISQQPIYKTCESTGNNVPLVITVNTTTTDIKYTLQFESNEGAFSSTQVVYVPTNTDFRIIGSTFIREEIFLLAEHYTGLVPSPDSFTGVGSIWKLVIDDVTREHTLTLIYSGYIDFTQQHPVAPTAITGRYESDEIKRIYWTDFYNKIRTINVANPQIMAFDPALLSVFPSVSFEIPILKTINSTGSLDQGTYELAYRLKKANTVISNYSASSNLVNLLINPVASNYRTYEGPSSITNSGCSITWKVNNIDTNFDYIEYVILYRDTKTDLPKIYITDPIDIGTYETKDFILTSVTSLKTLELDEYLIVSSGFTHAKTVDTKDNRLFWGNVYGGSTVDISEKFDSRAFRAAADGNIWLTNTDTESIYTLQQAIDLPKNSDCINKYYDTNGDEYIKAGYYKPGSGIVGGKGKYVEYEFGTEEILLSNLSTTEGEYDDWNFNQEQAPLIGSYEGWNNTTSLSDVSNPTTLITAPSDSSDQTYTMTGIGLSKNPYFTSTLKGFQHEEIYRFGIQFFDLQGNPYFVQWIGDIKMPRYRDINSNRGPNATSAGVNDFRNSFLYNSNIYGQALCVKFKIDISPVKNIISGYQIVRVERTDADKTILGTGMVTNTVADDHSTTAALGGGLLGSGLIKPYLPFPNQRCFETLAQANPSTYNGEPLTEAEFKVSSRITTFDSFDFMTNGYSFKEGDRLLLRSRVLPINFNNAQAYQNNCRYRLGFGDLNTWLRNTATGASSHPAQTSLPGEYDSGRINGTGFDSTIMPFFILFYYDEHTALSNNASFGGDPRTNAQKQNLNKVISLGQSVGSAASVSSGVGAYDFLNKFTSYSTSGGTPGASGQTVMLTFDDINMVDSYYFGAKYDNGGKLMALYYRANPNQYNGNTYTARTTNEYIACGSYIPVNRNRKLLNNNVTLTQKVFNGDVFLNYWDLNKIIKNIGGGTNFQNYAWIGSSPSDDPPGGGILQTTKFDIGNLFYFPCTNNNNQQVRYGNHGDYNLNNTTYSVYDDYGYNFYHSNEKNINKYFPKPLDFIISSKWINRIHYSEKKFNNEIDDSWTQYLTNSFYDVEGNYGAINAVVALNNQLHYIQERGIGYLIVNPVAMINSTTVNTPIKLGTGSTVERHEYNHLDVGTNHQWSVYKSQSQIMFLDVRSKKLYLYNGQTATPISDMLGQRNFIIKRLHDKLVNHDNPVIGEGVMTTYDYSNNEFIITFLNGNNTVPATTDEFYTISFSEQLNKFVSYYSFLPNLYINNNRYLLSNVNSDTLRNKVYLHNYGDYGKFYGVTYPNTLKLLSNEQPMYTKVFDNLQWITESVNDNLQWSDDLNITPGAITSPSYPDDIQIKDNTFSKVRVYNQYQNTDWTTLTLTTPNNNLRKLEQGFNFQVPRNKFNYNTTQPSTNSLFESSKLTRTTFGERIRDKWSVVDLYYANSPNLRFIVHTVKSIFRISDR